MKNSIILTITVISKKEKGLIHKYIMKKIFLIITTMFNRKEDYSIHKHNQQRLFRQINIKTQKAREK